MDEASTQVHEVYTRYGLAVCRAQVLETEAWTALSLLEARGDPSPVTRWRLEEMQEELAASTFGHIVHRLNRSREVPLPLRQMLKEAVEKRNWLTHRYFWDRCVELLNVRGRDLMIEELMKLDAWFQELDTQLTAVTRQIIGEPGLTLIRDAFAAEMADLLSAEATPVSIRRKLNKKETVVKVYLYMWVDTATGASCRIPLFQLSDDTFCSLCDCGITYGPEVVVRESLTPLDEFDDLFPAEVTIKPKDASNWNFRIPLGTAAYVCVERVQAKGGTVQWFVRRKSG